MKTPEQRERANTAARLWRERNPEASRLASRRYREKDPEAYRARERARTSNRLSSRFTKEERSAYYLVKNYGPAAPAHKAEQISKQEGLCAICKRTLVGVGDLDHNHATNQLRGVLCERCNVGLHYLEAPGWKEIAEAYLRKWESINVGV